jgi:hypothetical protein
MGKASDGGVPTIGRRSIFPKCSCVFMMVNHRHLPDGVTARYLERVSDVFIDSTELYSVDHFKNRNPSEKRSP